MLKSKYQTGSFIVSPINTILTGNHLKFTSPVQITYNQIMLESASFN